MSYNDAMASVKSFIELIDQIKKMSNDLNDTQKMFSPEIEKLNGLINTIDEHKVNFTQVKEQLEKEIAGNLEFRLESINAFKDFNNYNVKSIENIANELKILKYSVIEQIDKGFSNGYNKFDEKQKDIINNIESISNQLKISESNLYELMKKQGRTNSILFGILIFMVVLLGILVFL